jgi:TatD DNase family protein
VAAGIIDTHCHLHRAEFEADRDAIIARARQIGLTALIDPATDVASSRTVVETVQKYPELYGAIGVHPQDTAGLTAEGLAELRRLAAAPKIVAIGEIGLDYYRESTPRSVQQKALRDLLAIARETNKPVILHCRQEESGGLAGQGGQAYQDLFSILRECMPLPIRGVLHCFSGDEAAAKEALDLGLYLSFSGILTFTKAEALRAVAKQVPFDRVMLETDAPFLAPQPYRGKRNEPAFLDALVKTWAEIKDLSEEDVRRVTSVNAWHLFGVGDPPVRGHISYAIRDSLYINLTNACTDRCVFCALSDDQFWKGEGTSPFVKGYHLRMAKDPSVQEVLDSVGDPSRYKEIVFCGYGEPIIRLKELREIALRLREKGAKSIRINTNGHGNLIHKRPIAADLKGIADEISVSLNTPTAEQYLEICRPSFGLPAYDSIKQFIRDCRDQGIRVVATVVAMPGVDVEACRKVAEQELKVAYRIRTYDDVG